MIVSIIAMVRVVIARSEPEIEIGGWWRKK